jgi:hypothetical protein
MQSYSGARVSLFFMERHVCGCMAPACCVPRWAHLAYEMWWPRENDEGAGKGPAGLVSGAHTQLAPTFRRVPDLDRPGEIGNDDDRDMVARQWYGSSKMAQRASRLIAYDVAT